MKTIRYSDAALKSLRTHRGEAKRIMAKLADYAATGAGDVVTMSGKAYGPNAKRLRIGAFRAVFQETETEILVTIVGPRRDVYES